jgi:predicted dehydrogenase
MKRLRWGIITTGHIADVFARGVAVSRTGHLVAVASRTVEKAEKFARLHKIPKAYGNYGDLLKDQSVEAVYIATPHPMHAEWAIKAAKAGKHILCEKPLTMNYQDSRAVVQTAHRNRVFLMEAFMYRCHPQTAKLVELIRQKIIGEVRLIQAAFCYETPVDVKHRLFNTRLGGGGILDVGCYPVSMARLIAGTALGKPFAEPLEVKGTAVIGPKSHVDEIALASIKFPGDILVELSCAIRVNRGESSVKIDGSKGSLTVLSPWFAKWNAGTSYFLLKKHSQKTSQKIPIHCDRNLYTVEADRVAEYIRQGKKECPDMSWADTLGNMKVLDQWRKSVGIKTH